MRVPQKMYPAHDESTKPTKLRMHPPTVRSVLPALPGVEGRLCRSVIVVSAERSAWTETAASRRATRGGTMTSDLANRKLENPLHRAVLDVGAGEGSRIQVTGQGGRSVFATPGCKRGWFVKSQSLVNCGQPALMYSTYDPRSATHVRWNPRATMPTGFP